MVGVILSMLSGGFGLLKRIPPRLWLILGAFAALWLLWAAHNNAVSHARSDGRKQGKQEATAQFVAAQAEAARLATIDKQAKEAQYEIARAKSAEAYADLSGRYRAAVLQLGTKADPGRASAAHLPRPPEGSRLPEGPPGDAFVSVSQSDALICAENAAYSMAAWKWAHELETPQ